jgi:hypothetical protein
MQRGVSQDQGNLNIASASLSLLCRFIIRSRLKFQMLFKPLPFILTLFYIFKARILVDSSQSMDHLGGEAASNILRNLTYLSEIEYSRKFQKRI